MGASVQIPQACVIQHIKADAGVVFDAWLDPNMIGEWMFGPKLRKEQVLSIGVDPRVGGAFSFLVRRNGVEIDHVGRYLEIERPRRLVFTWGIADETSFSKVSVEIKPLADGSELILTHELDPAWVHFVDKSKEGWTKMVQALASMFVN